MNGKQINENIHKHTPEVLRLECYKIVEDYVIKSRFDRKDEEVTDEQMDKMFDKAERLYQYITNGTSQTQELTHGEDDEDIPEKTKRAYLEWLDYKRVACRKPIEVIKKKLTVPSDFIFNVEDVITDCYRDKRLIYIELSVNCEREDGTTYKRYITLHKTAEELDLDFYDCSGTSTSKVIAYKGDTPKVFSDGRKVYPYTYKVILK